MKKLITIFFASLAITANATNYYVKQNGNDEAAGTSDETAWATIAKVNTVWAAGTFAPGDSILFKRGETFTGSITVSEAGSSGSQIVVGAYGTGANPVIDGFQSLTTWTSFSGSIYYASLTCQSPPEMILIDGIQYAKGRWPNAGNWMGIETRNSTTQITDNELSSSPDWTGAELVLRENRWILSRHTITDHEGTSLYFTPALTYNPTGFGYFIQNSLATLDTFGEWYFDTSTSRLYMHFGGTTPSQHSIKASAIDRGINNSSGHQFVTIRDLTIQGFNTGSVYAYFANYDPHGFVVQNCNILHSGGDAIYINRSSSDTIRNNTINHSNHAAVTLWGNFGSFCSITGNNISNTGTIPGAAFNSYGTTWANNAYNAVYTNPNYTTVANNRITNTGYIPINFRGTDAEISHNYIDTYCYVKDDGAGIYVFDDENTGKQVLDNIILNGLGATGGMHVNTVISAHGIYTDGESANVTFERNIIGHMAKAGYHGNLPRNVIIRDNIFFQCQQFLNLWKYYTDGVFISGLTIKKNHFVSTKLNENLPALYFYQNSSSEYYSDIETEIAHFGTIDSNYFHVNTENLAYILLAPSGETGIAPYSFKRWTAEFGHDAHSQITKLETYTINSLGSNLISNGTFDSNINGWTGSSNAPISWDNTNALGYGGSLLLETQVPEHMYYWWTNTYDIYTTMPVAMDNTKRYIFRVTTKSDLDGKVVAFKTRNTGTGHEIQRFFSVPNTATEKEVLLSYPETTTSPSYFKFASCDDQTNVWFDNVRFYEADVTIKDPDSYLHLIYNDTDQNNSYRLSTTMEDPTGAEHSGTVVLNPWEGMILIGEGSITTGDVVIVKSRTGSLLRSRTGNFLKPNY